jgi:hypothetical protein
MPYLPGRKTAALQAPVMTAAMCLTALPSLAYRISEVMFSLSPSLFGFPVLLSACFDFPQLCRV